MQAPLRTSFLWAAPLLAGALLALGGLQGQAQSRTDGPNPFKALAGSWSGTGTVTLASGADERIRCRAVYHVPTERTLQQNLRCASDSYNFDLRSDVEYHGEEFSGNWIETTRNASGRIAGRATSGHIQAVVQGPAFSAGLSVATRGNRQEVTITSQGSALRQVSIMLTRASR
jgi:hypothetical protein